MVGKYILPSKSTQKFILPNIHKRKQLEEEEEERKISQFLVFISFLVDI